MAYTDKIKTYTIDLSLPESERWQEVIDSESRSAKAFINKNWESYYSVLAPIIKKIYKERGGLYVEEMQSLTDMFQMPIRKIIFFNCLYSLWLAREYLELRSKSIFGCTAGIKWVKGLGNIHMRNMDYAAPGLGNATRIFVFKRGRRKFITVGILGMVGVLSGMLPKKYSVTINYAPTIKMPISYGYDPLMLLREVFEDCDSYEDAVTKLKKTRLSTNVFFLISGAKKGQACIIERTQNSYNIRNIEKNVLAQANHFNTRKFQKHNAYLKTWDGEEWDTDSLKRQSGLENKIKQFKGKPTFSNFKKCLDSRNVLVDDTYQQMIFLTSKGDFKAWRRI